MKNLFAAFLLVGLTITANAQVKISTYGTFYTTSQFNASIVQAMIDKSNKAQDDTLAAFRKIIYSILKLDATTAKRIIDSSGVKGLIDLKANADLFNNYKATTDIRLISLEGWRTVAIDKISKLETRPTITQADIDALKSAVAKIPTTATSTSTTITKTTLQ